MRHASFSGQRHQRPIFDGQKTVRSSLALLLAIFAFSALVGRTSTLLIQLESLRLPKPWSGGGGEGVS